MRRGLGETCAKIVDLCEQLNKDIDSFVDMKAEVIQTIDQYVDDLKDSCFAMSTSLKPCWNISKASFRRSLPSDKGNTPPYFLFKTKQPSKRPALKVIHEYLDRNAAKGCFLTCRR